MSVVIVTGGTFGIGRAITAHLAAEGHQVASHGYDHGILIFRGPRHLRDQLVRTEQAVERAVGSDAMSRLFRARRQLEPEGHAVDEAADPQHGGGGDGVEGEAGIIVDDVHPPHAERVIDDRGQRQRPAETARLPPQVRAEILQ